MGASPEKAGLMKAALALVLGVGALAAPMAARAQAVTAYLEAESLAPDARADLAAHIRTAFEKRNASIVLVSEKQDAQFTLRLAPSGKHKGASRVASCMFVSCDDMAGSSSLAVAWIDNRTLAVQDSFTVGAHWGASYRYNQKRMAESIAKHLKHFLDGTGT